MLWKIFHKGIITDQKSAYFRYIDFKKKFIMILSAVVVLSVFISFAVGEYDIRFFESLEIVYNTILYGPNDSLAERIVWELRVPRGIMAAIVGAALAVGGSVMQSMLHNPLADPYTTGVSSGASLGAAIAIVLGISIIPLGTGMSSTILNAFIMALIPAFFIMGLSAFKKVTSTTMILIGIGVMYMFSAFTQMLKLLATPTQMEQLYMWQLGSLSESDLNSIPVVLIASALCIFALYYFRSDLNLISVGDNSALTMGTNPWRTRIICLIIVSFMTAVCVSYTGTIGFVGLVAPQMVRMFIGSDNKYLIPASAMFGAVFLVLADCASRVVGDSGVPVGVITAIVGSPVFLYLLIKRSKRTIF